MIFLIPHLSDIWKGIESSGELRWQFKDAESDSLLLRLAVQVGGCSVFNLRAASPSSSKERSLVTAPKHQGEPTLMGKGPQQTDDICFDKIS